MKDTLVFGPFISTGLTAVACKRLGVKFIGFEIDLQEYEKLGVLRSNQ